jgi:hypothetical protein
MKSDGGRLWEIAVSRLCSLMCFLVSLWTHDGAATALEPMNGALYVEDQNLVHRDPVLGQRSVERLDSR